MHLHRIEAFAAQLRERDWDAALLSAPNTLGYLTSVFESGYERMLMLAIRADGEVRGIVPALSLTQFERHGVTGLTGWSDSENPIERFESLAEDWDLRYAVIGVENSMRADHLLAVQEVLPAAKFHPAGSAVGALRAVKDASEIEALREAGSHADAVFDQVVNRLSPGMTERQVEAEIRSQFMNRGVKSTFCIIAAGSNSAEPHHMTDDTVLESGQLVLLDFGCEVRGYQADITRCVHFGPAHQKLKETYQMVSSAYHAALNAVRPGVVASEVDAAARTSLQHAGVGDLFVHRTGHGIGLDGHEDPNISSKNLAPLVHGNCFSIEPGVYYPREFGIRLENIVACGIAGDDAVSLNAPFSAELIEL